MNTQPRTLNELFDAAVDRYRDSEFFRFKRDDEWRSLTYGEVGGRVRELALGLYSVGLRGGDRIAIWSENRPEWSIADLGSLALGAVDVPIYATQAADQVEYMLTDSGARGIFVSSPFLPKARALRARIPSLEFIFLLDSLGSGVEDESTFDLSELVNHGRGLDGEQPALYESLYSAAKPESLATLLYTSGTTGDPKGVMLTHKNLTANVLNSFRWLELEGKRDLALTYLPFSHIFERSAIYLYAHCGTIVAFAEGIDAVAKNLVEIKPTVMTSVPRMFEKIYAKIMERGMSAGFPKRQIFIWSLDVGREWAVRRDRGRRVGLWLEVKHKLADGLVFKKWRDAMGGNIRVFISGGAALAPEIGFLFEAAGLRILQGYGLTETSPSVSCNTESQNRIGTVGQVMDGVRVRIASDGEILVKGDTIMKGYYNRPDENAEAFTEDGWFRTGDIGEIDRDGFLTITDRKKDLIKTSGGKYIAPQRIESLIKSSRFVSQVVVIGNSRKFASALIVPNIQMLRDYAALKGITYANDSGLIEHPRVVDLIERQVDKYTSELARFEKVKRVALLPQELTAEAGELTLTLKPRRSFIEKKYSAVIDKLYEEEAPSLAVV